MTPLEDVGKCYVQVIYIKNEKIKLFLTGLVSLSHLVHFSYVKFWLC